MEAALNTPSIIAAYSAVIRQRIRALKTAHVVFQPFGTLPDIKPADAKVTSADRLPLTVRSQIQVAKKSLTSIAKANRPLNSVVATAI